MGADQVGIARVATQHLIGRECREIIHLHASDARLIGYRQALRAAKIPARSKWVYRGNDVSMSLSAKGGEAAVEEQDSFDVVLTGVGDKKIQVIKEVRALTSLGLKEAKDVVDGAPSAVLEAVDKETAEKAKETLEGAGASVELK